MQTSETSNERDDAVVRCRDLAAGYGSKPVLEGIDLEIERGEIVCLLGGSGSGKSTLLKTIVGLLPPLEGRVELLGRDVASLQNSERQRLLQRTGTLFQHGALFGSRTIYENIALPLRENTDVPEEVIREMIRMKLALVGLEGLEHRLPSDISGGQRKRVALVRASIMDPEIIFADEPSSGLDPVIAAGVDRVLRQFQRLFGMTMVVVTHELESIRVLADRVIMLADGGIIARGTVEELSESDDPRVHDFFHRQAPDYAEPQTESTLLELFESST